MSGKSDLVLKTKGDEAFLSVKRLVVTLEWTADVDLDLMAFYETKDLKKGGVFSNLYPGGSLGDLNCFPYIELSGDEGEQSAVLEKKEVLKIAKLDDMAKVFIVTINYTNATKNRDVYFDSYDARVTVEDDKGHTIQVRLDSSDRGHVAVIARIDNTGPIGAKLINMNEIMDLPDFVGTVPGAELVINR